MSNENNQVDVVQEYPTRFEHLKPFQTYPDYAVPEDEIIIHVGNEVLKYKTDDLAFMNKITIGQAYIAALIRTNTDWGDYRNRIYFKNPKNPTVISPDYMKAVNSWTIHLKNDFDRINYCLQKLKQPKMVLSEEAKADLEFVTNRNKL